MCKPCENKPSNAYYTSRAADKSNCPYECGPGVESVDVNPYCENALNVQIHRDGGTQNSLIFVAVSFCMLFATWACLALHSDKSRVPQTTVVYETVDAKNTHMVEADS